MALTQDILKVAIVMISRAPCKGEEAQDVAITLAALKAEFEKLGQPNIDEDDNGDES